MQTAFVVNHGPRPYREKWDNEEITIPPGGRKEMERTEAIRFLGTFAAEQKDANGDTISGKTLHLEENGDPWASKEAQSFISQIDGQDYGSEAALKAHYAEFQHMRMVRDVAEDVSEKLKLTQTTDKASKVFACHICAFESTSKPGLLGHLRSHDAKSVTNAG